MQKRLMLQGTAAIVLFLGLVWSAAAGPQNLIPDPQFKNFDYDPLKHREVWKQRWIPYQIKAPSEWKLDAGKQAVELKGGQTFLHSPRFAVTAGKKLSVAVTAEGSGKVSVQFLWWKEDGGMTEPHRTIPVEPVEVKGASQRITGTDTAPEGAAEAYIRIVVEEGTVTVSQPEVTVAE